MNAMKKYRERQVRDRARQLVNDNLDNFIEHMDVLILYALHREFGFGAKRLRKFYDVIGEYYTYFRDRFVKPGDENRFYGPEKRMDTDAIKYYLREEAGFGYDAVVAEKRRKGAGTMTQREKSMNLKVFLFSAAAISAIASVVYASGIPGIRHPGFPHVPVERIAEETAADVIVIRDPETETETAEIAAESTAAARPWIRSAGWTFSIRRDTRTASSAGSRKTPKSSLWICRRNEYEANEKKRRHGLRYVRGL